MNSRRSVVAVVSILAWNGRAQSFSSSPALASTILKTKTTAASHQGRYPCRSAFSRPSFKRILRGGETALSVATSSSSSSKTTTEMSAVDASATTSKKTAYDELVPKLEAITHLGRAQSVLGYDQQVFMPSAATAERGAQLAALATVLHAQKTDPKLLELMDRALQDEKNSLDKDSLRLLELERKSFVENQRVPSELAAKAASLSATAHAEWVKARQAKDFAMFADTLKECFDTAMEIAKAKQGSAERLYDFMLDEYEIGMSQERIDTIFDQVERVLVPLIEKVLASPHRPSQDPLVGEFEMDKQKAVCEQLVKAIGFNTEQGRIDVSVHPFTSSMSPNDVRITSRFRTDEWCQGLVGSIHEAGHAMYEQSLPKSALSIDTALSMGTHESQSLFWERHVGLSKSFWKYATPILQQTFDGESNPFSKYTPDDIYGAINAVLTESLIRVEADELNYPLHVILRYNIEKDVMAGKLAVQDIPQRWNEDMKRYLKVEVPSEDKGCLQDIHWSALAFGYFPTYLIGAIAAAQLFHYCEKDIPDIHDQIASGSFGAIKAWLTDKVHRHGRRYKSLDAMLTEQLGEPLNPEYFLNYLNEKYTDLYKL